MTVTTLLPAFAFPAKALDRPLLIKCALLSLLMHVVVIIVFGEAVGIGDDGGSIPGTAALAVRLKLRWTKPEVAEAPAPPHAPVPRSPAQSTPPPTVSAHSSAPAVDALPESAQDTAALPLPRIAAEPLTRIEAPTMRVVPPDAPRLPEPPPLPRIEAEPLAPAAATAPAVMRPAPQAAAPLAEPPPLPRIEAEPLAPVAPTTAAVMRPAPQDAPLVAEPRGSSAVAPPPDEARPARAGSTPSGPAAPNAATLPPGPTRLNFGPRRSVDPDLATLVGESAPEAPPAPNKPAGLDVEATRALARNLHRAPATTKPGRAMDLSGPKPDTESTLGRAIGKAAQPDCRVAYAGLGLLGIPFLLFDTVTDTGCRW
jgi:hypothetical protein